LIPEFIGRFPVLTYTSELTLSELISILYLPTNAIMKQYSYAFALFDIQLLCTPQANEQIAEIAYEKKTGARGLRTIVEKILTPAMFLVPSHAKRQARRAGAGGGSGTETGGESGEVDDVSQSPTLTKSLLQPQQRHPVYHTVIIDERSARQERGVVLLTHEITIEQFYGLSEEEIRSDQRIRIASHESLPHP
jgi:hypothetical protein